MAQLVLLAQHLRRPLAHAEEWLDECSELFDNCGLEYSVGLETTAAEIITSTLHLVPQLVAIETAELKVHRIDVICSAIDFLTIAHSERCHANFFAYHNPFVLMERTLGWLQHQELGSAYDETRDSVLQLLGTQAMVFIPSILFAHFLVTSASTHLEPDRAGVDSIAQTETVEG